MGGPEAGPVQVRGRRKQSISWEVRGMTAHDIEGLIAVIGAFSVPIVGVLGWVVTSWIRQWRQVRVSEHLAALKQNMIERGMSADEIERVINAGLPARGTADKATEDPAGTRCCG
jgi:hypothetical protein